MREPIARGVSQQQQATGACIGADFAQPRPDEDVEYKRKPQQRAQMRLVIEMQESIQDGYRE